MTNTNEPKNWKVQETDSGVFCVKPIPGQIVADVYTEEDAHFIARACNSHYELLEAARQLLAEMDSLGSEYYWQSNGKNANRLEDAIKKAKGEQL